jgi:hypothetical protein
MVKKQSAAISIKERGPIERRMCFAEASKHAAPR